MRLFIAYLIALILVLLYLYIKSENNWEKFLKVNNCKIISIRQGWSDIYYSKPTQTVYACDDGIIYYSN